jgi:hypothetical protein
LVQEVLVHLVLLSTDMMVKILFFHQLLLLLVVVEVREQLDLAMLAVLVEVQLHLGPVTHLLVVLELQIRVSQVGEATMVTQVGVVVEQVL